MLPTVQIRLAWTHTTDLSRMWRRLAIAGGDQSAGSRLDHSGDDPMRVLDDRHDHVEYPALG